MKFSLLIANYNNGNFFEDCYQSIISQTYNNWECIIVDDCSTDDSLKIISGRIGEDARFKIYKNGENKGCGYTKRKCAELANGEICGFLDPDDEITTNALELMVKTHIQNPSVALIHSKAIRWDENKKIISKYKRGKNVIRRDDFLNLDGEIFVFASYKNSFYKKTEGINSFLKRAVDMDLYLKLYEVGPTYFLDEFLYHYRIHSGGISTTQNVRKAEYWRWFVNMKAAERRGINLEDKFVTIFARQKELEDYKVKYYTLKKFEVFQKWINLLKGKR